MPLTDQDLSQLEQMYFEERFHELEVRAVDLTTQQPNLGLAWSILGAALTGQGKPALEALARAADLLPQDPQAQLQYADALLSCGQSAAAVIAYQRTIALQPDWAAAHNNLGNAFKALAQSENARHHYGLASQFDPHFALAHYNLAVLDRDEYQWENVEPALRRALNADPTLAVAWVELAGVLKDWGDLAGAELALVKAIELSPQLLQARLNLAAILLLRSRAKDAIQALRGVIALDPSSAQAHLQMGLALYAAGSTKEASDSVELALSLKDDLIDGYRFLSDVACDEGDIAQAAALLERVLKLDCSNVSARSNLLFYRSQLSEETPNQLFVEHAAFGQLLQTKYEPPRLPTHDLNDRSSRRLRVGFASGDFNNHIVGRSLLPVVAHLAAMEDIELIAYCNSMEEDDWTGRLRRHFGNWNMVAGMSPLALSRRIRADGIDILIDLSGHTPMNCLETFALRSAPVQVSWLGYTWTTGVQQVDYYLADQCWLPFGEFDHLFVEKLVYLSAFLPFEFQGRSPLVNDLPCRTGAPFTFASFNHPRKLSSKVIDAWTSILSRVSGSRLLLGGIAAGPQQNRIVEAFAAAGIAQERLLFFPRCQAYDYLELHHMVDMCLDAFPYPSATTIQHALWMGVPTVTMAGPTPVSRAGAAAMLHIDLPQYVADSPNAYVEKAVDAAKRSEELALLRSDLRQRFTESAQCRTDRIARSVHAALQRMWANHTQGKPAQSFSVLIG